MRRRLVEFLSDLDGVEIAILAMGVLIGAATTYVLIWGYITVLLAHPLWVGTLTAISVPVIRWVAGVIVESRR